MPVATVTRASARPALAIALAVLIGATGVLSDPATVTARARPGNGPTGFGAWVSAAAGMVQFAPLRQLFDQIVGAQSINTGSDGRLTVLLLGSDTRSTGFGRTDVIMVASLKDNVINFASIPRDTARILNPFTAAASDVFRGKINTILAQLKVPGISNQDALDQFEYVIEQILQVEIDYNALITFKGFEALVDEVDPVYVDITRRVRDPRFWDSPTSKGVYFPVANDYELFALPAGPLCNGAWKRNKANPPASTWCHRALPFVRSRKGAGNSDFVRARRQQDFVGATVQRVINRGSGALGALVNAANGQVGASQLYTNIPFGSDALDWYNALQNAALGNQVVFCGPCGGYATRVGRTTSWQLNLPAVRAWAAQYLN